MIRKFKISIFNSRYGKQMTVLAVAASLCLVQGACSSKEDKAAGGKPSGPRALQAEVVIVKPTPLETTYQSSGTLLSNEEINVYPEVSGRITSINFKEGSMVRKGQLLVQLYSAEIEAQIEKLKAQRKLAITTKERQDELLKISGISRQEYDNTLTSIASIDADIAFNEAQLRRLQIRAPFDGIIGLRNVSVGAVVSSATLITSIQQVHQLKIDFPIPDQYRNNVKVGSSFMFTVAGIQDTLRATVAAIQPVADATTRTVTVRGIVPNSSGKLVPGGFANVFFPLARTNDAITIPSQCIIPSTRDRKVALVRNGKAELVTVVTGTRLVENIEILQGLQSGDTVIATGIMQVKPGMDVKVTKVR
jgi:membrane fusion protein (multidrug efflux system)